MIALAAGVFSLAVNARVPAASLRESFAAGVRQVDVETVTVENVGGGSSVIIIATNEGGTSQNKYWNQPAMAVGKVHQVSKTFYPSRLQG